MTYTEAFKYFQDRLKYLKDEFGLDSYESNPCSIRTTDDIRSFVSKVNARVFREEVDFLEDKNELSENEGKVLFDFLGQELSLEIDKKFGHIELDFHQVIRFMAELSGILIATVNPTDVSIAGDQEDMETAWKQGLPIHLPEIDFYHMNLNGRFFKKEEISAYFTLNQEIKGDDFLTGYIDGVNSLLTEKGSELRYNRKQVKLVVGSRDNFSLMISGNGAGLVSVADGGSVFKNGFVSQVFLNEYCSANPDSIVWYQSKTGDKIQLTEPFSQFIARMGKNPI